MKDRYLVIIIAVCLALMVFAALRFRPKSPQLETLEIIEQRLERIEQHFTNAAVLPLEMKQLREKNE